MHAATSGTCCKMMMSALDSLSTRAASAISPAGSFAASVPPAIPSRGCKFQVITRTGAALNTVAVTTTHIATRAGKIRRAIGWVI